MTTERETVEAELTAEQTEVLAGEMTAIFAQMQAENAALKDLQKTHTALIFDLYARIDRMTKMAGILEIDVEMTFRRVITSITNGGSHAERNVDTIAAIREMTMKIPDVERQVERIERAGKGLKAVSAYDDDQIPF